MTDRLRYTDHTKPIDTLPLKVDVCMIQVRPDDHEWVIDAKRCVADQSYPHLGFLVVDNMDRSLSIGNAWNACVQASDADLLLFLGDDDGMTPDLVECMVHGWKHMGKQAPNLVHLTTNCTVLSHDLRLQAHVKVQHTGMYLRQFLLDHPFDGTLDRHVGRSKVEAIHTAGQAIGQPMTMGIMHHYGYLYRQHPWMVSGLQIKFEPHAHR